MDQPFPFDTFQHNLVSLPWVVITEPPLRKCSFRCGFWRYQDLGIAVSTAFKPKPIKRAPYGIARTMAVRAGFHWVAPDGVRLIVLPLVDKQCAPRMYHAYMMTDTFLWCYSDTFAEQYRVSDDQVPSWSVRFTPDIVREWTAMLARSPRTYRIR